LHPSPDQQIPSVAIDWVDGVLQFDVGITISSVVLLNTLGKNGHVFPSFFQQYKLQFILCLAMGLSEFVYWFILLMRARVAAIPLISKKVDLINLSR